MKLNRTVNTFAVDILYFTAGSILYALGLYTFALGANFSPGGISGIALMIHHYTNWPIGLLSLTLNIPLIIICGKIIGVPFVLKSIWAMLLNTFFIDVVFPLFPTYSGNRLLAAVFSGLLVGTGLALIYVRGASTGGSDFVTLSIKKKHPHYSVGQIAIVIEAVIILAGGFVYGDIDAVLYGAISLFAGNIAVDKILYGAGSSKLAIIVSDYGKEIAGAISAEVGRGATLLKATGAYTDAEKDMLLCACSPNEIFKVRHAAEAVDPDALILISEVHEVIGEGFAPSKLPGHEPIKNSRHKSKKEKPVGHHEASPPGDVPRQGAPPENGTPA